MRRPSFRSKHALGLISVGGAPPAKGSTKKTCASIVTMSPGCCSILAADASYALPSTVRGDMADFVAALSAQEDFDPTQFGVNMTRDVVMERLQAEHRL